MHASRISVSLPKDQSLRSLNYCNLSMAEREAEMEAEALDPSGVAQFSRLVEEEEEEEGKEEGIQHRPKLDPTFIQT